MLCDYLHAEDDDKPRDYYEFEPVKKIKVDHSLVPGARGMVVKVILYDLPPDYQYRVVFMERSMAEVRAQQKKMLERRNHAGGGVHENTMAVLFRAQLVKFEHWINDQENFSMLRVGYADMIVDPETAVNRGNAFLGGSLNRDAVVKAVDPELYRNRKVT